MIKRITAFFLLALCCLAFLACQKEEKENITPATVDILSVGKGDCIVIRTGSKTVMIDAGKEEDFYRVRTFLASVGCEHIDTLILTHPDKDHIGGARSVIAEYGVDTVIETHIVSNTAEYTAYHALLSELGIQALAPTENYSFTYDSCYFEVDVPKKTKYKDKQDNNSSLIISMKCGENNLLFCGDAMELRLAEWLSEDRASYDFVKLPYHGNYLLNYTAFLESIKPTYAAITCSDKNPPQQKTLTLLSQKGVQVYQSRYGRIRILANGTEISVKQG